MARRRYIFEKDCTSLDGKVLKQGTHVWADPEEKRDSVIVMCYIGTERREFHFLPPSIIHPDVS